MIKRSIFEQQVLWYLQVKMSPPPLTFLQTYVQKKQDEDYLSSYYSVHPTKLIAFLSRLMNMTRFTPKSTVRFIKIITDRVNQMLLLLRF